METFEFMKLCEKLDALTARIKTLAEKKDKPEPTKSDSTKELFTALAKAQGDMKPASLSSENPYFKSKYADFNELIKTARPALAKYNLCVTQLIINNDDGQSLLQTIIGHSSGEWISMHMKINPAKSDIQSLGSYITYLKRYSYAMLVGISTADEDDDGEQAVATERNVAAKGVALNTKYNPKENKYETITKEQLEELEYELAQYPDITEMILDGLKIQSIANMPKAKFLPAITRIREIKKVRNENS